MHTISTEKVDNLATLLYIFKEKRCNCLTWHFRWMEPTKAMSVVVEKPGTLLLKGHCEMNDKLLILRKIGLFEGNTKYETFFIDPHHVMNICSSYGNPTKISAMNGVHFRKCSYNAFKKGVQNWWELKLLGPIGSNFFFQLVTPSCYIDTITVSYLL